MLALNFGRPIEAATSSNDGLPKLGEPVALLTSHEEPVIQVATVRHRCEDYAELTSPNVLLWADRGDATVFSSDRSPARRPHA